MTITTEIQAVVPSHKWQGIASSIIGATAIMITLLLVGIATSGTEPPEPIITALWVLSSGILCANLIGIALAFYGVKDPSSRRLYSLLGVTLNVVNLMTYVALAFVGLSMNAS